MRADSSGYRPSISGSTTSPSAAPSTPTQLDRYLHGDGEIGNAEHNVLVHALNEVFFARGHDHPLAYRPL